MSLLPPNATNLETGLTEAVQAPGLPTPLGALWSPDACPLTLLPWLAWALSIENWNPAWPESVKRERVRQAIAIQRIKGTRQSVEDAVIALGGQVEIVEWFERTPPGDPYTFDLVLDLADAEGAPPTQAYLDSVVREVTRTKPARAHFEVTQKLKASATVAVVARVRPAIYARLTLNAPEEA